MTWTAPQVERPQAPGRAGERETLEAMLDEGRATLLAKCAGLTAEQLAERSVPPSPLSLLGLVRHMAMVERWWFRESVRGEDVPLLYAREDDMDAEFSEAGPATAQADLDVFRAEVDAARAAARGLPLEYPFTGIRSRRELSLRWVYVHMIEEYARHNGHADFLRERIDGATGV